MAGEATEEVVVPKVQATLIIKTGGDKKKPPDSRDKELR